MPVPVESDNHSVADTPYEHWPYVRNNTLAGLHQAATARLIQLHGELVEADTRTNSLSRAIIARTKIETGHAWLYHINLYGTDRKNRDAICTEFTGQMIYNFDYDAIAPIRDDHLIDLIHERDTAEYTGTAADYDRLTHISDRLAEIGGTHLFWS